MLGGIVKKEWKGEKEQKEEERMRGKERGERIIEEEYEECK